jgi:hypothetical protein
MSTSRDIRDLLEARASSGRDEFLISKTIFTKIGTGSTAACQRWAMLAPTSRAEMSALARIADLLSTSKDVADVP